MNKTIIFDLGGVYFTDGTRAAIEAIATGYRVDRAAVKDVLKGDLGNRYRVGALSAAQFWQRAKTSWDIQTSSAELARLWNSAYQPDDGTVGLVKRLRNAGHELLYLSDNTAERVAYLDKKYNFLAKFADGIFSHLAECKKPDPAIYRLVLQKASHPAAACVYIDDKPDYLIPAERLGMAVIAFKNAGQLEADLKQLALLPEDS